MSEIKLKESFANFLYFFVATLVLAFIGANIPSLAKDISEIMQEHLAGKTILTFSGITLFLAFCCATKNIFKQQPYGKLAQLLIISPSNFIITLAFVAAAMNWAVTISSPILFPLVVNQEIAIQLAGNSLEITSIAIGVGLSSWALHWSPTSNKISAPFDTPTSTLFWVIYAASAIFWFSFLATIISRAVGI
ncbi:hypothetical protein [Stutzerimonas chloritidismutans]